MTRTALILSLLIVCMGAYSHEARPAYLEIRETKPGQYNALWKTPAAGENLRLGIYVELPAGCKNVTEPQTTVQNAVASERWTFVCPGGLVGGTVQIAGLAGTLSDVLVRVEHLGGATQITRLTPSSTSFTVAATPDSLEVAGTYLVLGVEHILAGIDHLLFVLALLLIVGQRWGLLLQTVTAFTVAHSLTLAAAALGYVHVPSGPVEAVIALSIVFVASEILHMRAGRPSLTARAPWLVAFLFGLLHGFGFAGALAETGLPQHSIPLALVLFNVGVEAGQIIFVAAVIGLTGLLRRMRVSWPRWMELVPPYAIGSAAFFWVIQRIASI